MKELHFEVGKKVATERLKTDEELIKEAREKLEKLESERIKRMRGHTEPEEDPKEIRDEEESEDETEGESSDEEEAEGEEEEEESEDEDDNSDLNDEEDDEVPKKKPKKDLKKNDKPVVNIQEIMEAAKKEIPYTFKIPETFDELTGHFKGETRYISLHFKTNVSLIQVHDCLIPSVSRSFPRGPFHYPPKNSEMQPPAVRRKQLAQTPELVHLSPAIHP